MFNDTELLIAEAITVIALVMCFFATLEEIKSTLFLLSSIIGVDVILKLLQWISKSWIWGHKLELTTLVCAFYWVLRDSK